VEFILFVLHDRSVQDKKLTKKSSLIFGRSFLASSISIHSIFFTFNDHSLLIRVFQVYARHMCARPYKIRMSR
jgi:hypothetical protein